MFSTTFFFIALCAVSVVGWSFFGLAVAVLGDTRKQRDRFLSASDVLTSKNRRLTAWLERIRDLGPHLPARRAGAEDALPGWAAPRLGPLPSCRFCGQGPGHWGGPTGDGPPGCENCPAVMAWRALRGDDTPGARA